MSKYGLQVGDLVESNLIQLYISIGLSMLETTKLCTIIKLVK